jgi:predicted CopG family antitoxin
MKTTIVLRDDLYSLLVRVYGPRGISKAINTFISEKLLRKKKSMFGADSTLKSFVREEDELDRFS